MRSDGKLILESLGFTVKGKRYNENHRYVYLVEYPCGHEYEGECHYLKKRAECKICFGVKGKLMEESTVLGLCSSKGYTFKGLSKDVRGYPILDVVCNEGHPWSVYLYNFRKDGRECPYCKTTPQEDKWLYLQEATDQSGVKYLKYGITQNDPMERLKRQSRASNMKHMLVCYAVCKSKDVISLEKYLKNNLDFVDLGYKFDGYTEVVSYRHYDYLMKFICNSCFYEGDLDLYNQHVLKIRGLKNESI